MVKKLLCIIISILMIVSVLPTGIVAADNSYTYSFSDVTVTGRWSGTTYSADTDGSLTYTFTGSGNEVWFSLPSEVNANALTSISVNITTGSVSDFCIKVYVSTDGGSSYTALGTYGGFFGVSSQSLTGYADSIAAADSVKIGLMYNGSSTNVEYVVNSFTVTTSASSGTTTTASGDYTFSDVAVTGRWSNTTYDANEDGSLTHEFTSQYEELWFSLPDGIDTDSVISITINVTSGSTSTMGVKLYDSTTSCYVTYGNNTLTIASAGTSTTSYATAGKIGIMYTSSDGSATYTFSGFSVTYTSTSSDTGDTGDTGDTTDYTFPIEGHAYGNGSSAYDTTTGVVTFETAWGSCIGWYFGESSTIKLESLTITFAEAVPNYMQLVVVYCSGQKDSSVGIGSGTTVTISAGEYSSDNNSVIDASECIKQIYLQSNTAGSSVTIASVTYTLATENLPTFYGRALTLDGEIGVTYYFDMTDVDNASDYVLSASIGGATAKDYSLGSTVDIDGKTYYRYTVYVLPTQLTSTIKATLTDGTNTVEVSEYSVSTYCERAIGYAADGDTSWDDTANLCKQVLNYGYYLDLWLNNGTSTSGIDISKLDDSWTDPVTGTWNVDFSSYNSTSDTVSKTLALDGKGIYIRVYVLDNTAGYTVSGKTLETGTDSNGQYIEFKVAADEMADILTVCNADGTTYTTYSIYSYIKNNVSNSDTNLVNLCKAIYYYCEAALNYDWV